MLEGKLKGLYVIGENPKLSDSDWNHLSHALKKLDFLVVQELFLSETAQVADVVFSAASVAEKEGTVSTRERPLCTRRNLPGGRGNFMPSTTRTRRKCPMRNTLTF